MTISFWLYYLCAVLLLLNNLIGFGLNVTGLPGNWLIVVGAALFAWFVQFDGSGIDWPIVAVLLLLALLGEGIEFLAGMAGAARSGASRRAMALSVLGSIIGSIGGVMVGLPIPVLGSAVAAVVGGALGAAAGAAMGEDWAGRELEDSIQVGKAAFIGRILGTAGKLIVGAVMFVIATVDSLFW